MAEDVEIEYLLKENEQILKHAATLDGKRHLNNKKCSKPNLYYDKEKELNSETEFDLQEHLEERMLNYKAETKAGFVIDSIVLDSPFEDDSEDDFDELHEDEENFIKEVIDFGDPSFTARPVEKVQKQITNSSQGVISEGKMTSMNKLFRAQELITKQIELADAGIEKFMEELNQNLASQSQTRAKLEALSLKPGTFVKEPSFTRCYFKSFGMPYFEDHKGFTPPPNEDTKKKLERGEILLTTLPKVRFWLKPHKEVLQESIRETLVKENRNRLLNEVKKVERKLKLSLSEEAEKYALEELTNLQNELKKLKSKSYLELVMKENPDREYDWLKYYASDFKGLHSAEECRRFWHVYLKPSINKSSWEKGEDFRLSELAAEMNFEDWDKIAENLGTNRTAYQCFVHYHTKICANQDYTNGKWTEEEDKKLMSVVNASRWGDYIPWAKVAAHIPNRTHSQIYNRWYNSLNPNIVKGRFTKEEDLLLLAGVEVYGVSFKELSALLKNRTPTQLRERFERYLLPKTKTAGIWSLEEDKKLLQLVGVHGDHSWAEISNAMRTRSRTQVRQRYRFIQLMLRKDSSWAPEKIKRRQKRPVNSAVARILKKVGLAKQELQEIERNFKLSPVEKETLCIEKLTELRDKLFMNKFEIKDKKEELPDSWPMLNSVLSFFRIKSQRPNACQDVSVNQLDNVTILNEVQCLARYFKIELEVPSSVGEITDNMNLALPLQGFLLNTIEERTEILTQIDDSKISTCTEECLDYRPPDFDDTLEKPEWLKMTEWWESPPINVTNLNFGEFFKRTVFDYSSGMHKEIWEAKARRETTTPCDQKNLDDKNEEFQLPFYIPPNLLTTNGIKSMNFTRKRLKQDASKKICQNGLEHTQNKESRGVKYDPEFFSHLDELEDTFISLFAFPKLLSATSTNLTPFQNLFSTSIQIQKSTNENISNLLETSQNENEEDLRKDIQSHTKPYKLQKQKMKGTILEQNYVRKCQIRDYKKGIRFKKKVNIDHLIRKNKKKRKIALTDTSNILSGSLKQESETKKTIKKPKRSTVAKIENFKEKISRSENKQTIQGVKSKNVGSLDMQDSEDLKFEYPQETYKRTKKPKEFEGCSRKKRKLSTAVVEATISLEDPNENVSNNGRTSSQDKTLIENTIREELPLEPLKGEVQT